MSKTTAYIIAEKIQRKVEEWAKKGVSTWHATDIAPIIENYIFDSSKMQDMGGMVESCAKQVIAEFGEWMKKSTKGTRVDCTYAAPIQMLIDSATAHLIIKLEKEVIGSKRYLDGFALAEKECIELKAKLAKSEAEIARLTENLENASTVQSEMRTMLAKHGDMRAAIALAEEAMGGIPLDCDYAADARVDAALAAIAALKPVAEESSDTPAEPTKAEQEFNSYHIRRYGVPAPEKEAPVAGPIPAAAQASQQDRWVNSLDQISEVMAAHVLAPAPYLLNPCESCHAPAVMTHPFDVGYLAVCSSCKNSVAYCGSERDAAAVWNQNNAPSAACDLPPEEWGKCSQPKGHEGPCTTPSPVRTMSLGEQDQEAAQMPCCPKCGKSDRVETWESYAKQHDYDAVRKDGYTHICPCYCEFAFGECDCQFFTPQPEGCEPCATMKTSAVAESLDGNPKEKLSPMANPAPSMVASNAAPEQVDPAAATSVEVSYIDSGAFQGGEEDVSIANIRRGDTCYVIKSADLTELRRDRARLEMCEDLIWHADIHSAYKQSGYMQMTTEQKSAWDEIIIRKRTEANAINNAMKGI